MTTATVSETVIDQLAQDIHDTAREKGFWEPPHPFLAEINGKLMLIVSEVAEAMEVMRNHYTDSPVSPFTQMTQKQAEDFLEELADIIIRTFDLGRYLDTGMGEILLGKMERNSARPTKHGKRY